MTQLPAITRRMQLQDIIKSHLVEMTSIEAKIADICEAAKPEITK